MLTKKIKGVLHFGPLEYLKAGAETMLHFDSLDGDLN